MGLQSSVNQILSVGAVLAQTNPYLQDSAKTRRALRQVDKKIEGSKAALNTISEFEETLYDEAVVQETDVNPAQLDFIANEEAEWSDRLANLEKEKFNLAPDKAQYGKYADIRERASLAARRQQAMSEASQAVEEARKDKGDVPSTLVSSRSYANFDQAVSETRGNK